MKKSIFTITMAVVLAGTSLAFPLQVHAADGIVINEGGRIEENNVCVLENNGTIIKNKDTVESNNGAITTNEGTVKDNNGSINCNYNIVTNNTKIENKENSGNIKKNYSTLTNNNENAYLEENFGVVTNNCGTIEYCYEGEITNNCSTGTIKYNCGDVINNDGTIEQNYGKITNNRGTVKDNRNNNVINNFGSVTLNSNGTGKVENNYGGTVIGGTAVNQWYEYILEGGNYVSGSKETVADNRTWIGKAESTDSELGDYYITVTANDGMTFDYAIINGKQVPYITNEDGTVSFGNIDSAISIFFKKLINNTDIDNDNDNNDNNNNNNLNVSVSTTNDNDMIAAIEAVVAAEEKMPVTSFTSDEAVAKIPATARSAGASYNLSKIVTSQGFIAAVNKISENVKSQNAVNNAANNNTARRTSVTIYSDKPMNFTADILNAISNSDIDFVFVFMHNGKMYRVTIPRGTNVNLNGRKYEGPLFIGRLLGTTEEIG